MSRALGAAFLGELERQASSPRTYLLTWIAGCYCYEARSESGGTEEEGWRDAGRSDYEHQPDCEKKVRGGGKKGCGRRGR